MFGFKSRGKRLSDKLRWQGERIDELEKKIRALKNEPLESEGYGERWPGKVGQEGERLSDRLRRKKERIDELKERIDKLEKKIRALKNEPLESELFNFDTGDTIRLPKVFAFDLGLSKGEQIDTSGDCLIYNRLMLALVKEEVPQIKSLNEAESKKDDSK